MILEVPLCRRPRLHVQDLSQLTYLAHENKLKMRKYDSDLHIFN